MFTLRKTASTRTAKSQTDSMQTIPSMIETGSNFVFWRENLNLARPGRPDSNVVKGEAENFQDLDFLSVSARRRLEKMNSSKRRSVNQPIENQTAIEQFKSLGEELQQYLLGLSDKAQQAFLSAQSTTLTVREELRSKQFLSAIWDTTETAIPLPKIISIFGFSSVLLISALVGSIIGSTILSPIFSMFLKPTGALIATILLSPILYGFGVEKTEDADCSSRGRLFVLSFLHGIVAGFSISMRFVYSQPLSFLAPLVIAFLMPVATTFAESSKNRVTFLAILAIGVVTAHVSLGLMSRSMSTIYLLLTAAYTAIVIAVLQLAIKEPERNSSVYEASIVIATLSMKVLTFVIFGSHQPYHEQWPENVK